jgi:hypothetical protein
MKRAFKKTVERRRDVPVAFHAPNVRDGGVSSAFPLTVAFQLMLIVLIGLSISAHATQPDELEIDAGYFHPAAGKYIHGDSAGASNIVARGLSRFPEDKKLKRLKELLEREQKQQQQNKDSQQNEDQQQDDQQQPQDNQQKPQDASQNGEQDQQQDPKDDQQNEQQPEPQSAEQMTPDEAKQLLDAMRQEEQNKRLQLHPVLGAPVKVDKDW